MIPIPRFYPILSGSRMKETLMLLRPEVRHTRIVESVEKSITIAGRMDEQQKGK